MKRFVQWLNEMAGTDAIVSCKDLKNPNFQIQGSLSNLNCKKKEQKIPYLTNPSDTKIKVS